MHSRWRGPFPLPSTLCPLTQPHLSTHRLRLSLSLNMTTVSHDDQGGYLALSYPFRFSL